MGKAARTKRRRTAPAVRLVTPNQPHFPDYIRRNAALCQRVVTKDSAIGQRLVLCGAGPSLAEHAHRCEDGDHVWAVNSALPWLIRHHHRVTHGFAVEVNEGVTTAWTPPPNVRYLLATASNPAFLERITAEGKHATVFHNFVDCPTQDALYQSLFPPTICAGSGLNAVTRALDVADYMGFREIVILGADCALRGDVMHVTGDGAVDSGCSDLFGTGTIDGRVWRAQMDLWVSANWLVRMARKNPRIELVGDTLPNALRRKPLAFLDRLPHTIDGRTGERIPIVV